MQFIQCLCVRKIDTNKLDMKAGAVRHGLFVPKELLQADCEHKTPHSMWRPHEHLAIALSTGLSAEPVPQQS